MRNRLHILMVRRGGVGRLLARAAALGLLLASPFSAHAAIQVTVSGPAGSAQQALPDAGGAFDLNLPLSANALNEITVTATDGRTNVISRTLRIAQLSLQSIVVSQIRTEPLSVQQIEQLVNDGVIQLDNPANFNVSQFAIVLTIGGQQIPIEFPLVGGSPEETAFESIPPLSDPGSGGGSNPNIPDVTIIEQQVSVPGVQGPAPLTIPGILVIEGRIKSLKEFYSVRLLLMNISGIFTLGDVTALISFPDGGLSATLPDSALADFGNILPGDGDLPGQKEREFIVRGDDLGVKRVRIDFGGVVRGPGIPDDAPIPFNGAALSSVEVKGPPNFLVEVTHPDSVTALVPYELEVKITNAGQAPALYTTFDLGVGFAGEILECTIDPITTNSVCTNTPGPVTRQLGHIFPGQTVSQRFTIWPFGTGPISSCLGISDQNITLQVNVGTIGCLTGHFPPTRGVPDGLPTVAVVPANNLLGASVTAPVAAFFSENMKTTTINGLSFQVFTGVDDPVAGQVHFQSILGRTVAVWQPLAGVLADNTEYRVVLTQDITDPDGNPLFNAWSSSFRTTSSLQDIDPPTLTLTILPPIDPNYVLPGQVIPVRAYAADQGSGIAHIALYARDLNVATSLYEHVDDKTIFSGADLPVTFSVDSARLVPGHSYIFRGSAYDQRGNVQDATIGAVIAASSSAPVIVLPPDPTNDILYGVSVPLAPAALTGGVRRVDYFVDGATNAFATMSLPPYATSLSTFGLALTTHTVRAEAVDGLGQTGADVLVFTLITNASEPVVSFTTPLPGAQYLTGSVIAVSGAATDVVDVTSVQFFLDAVTGPVLATGAGPFVISATNLSVGPHEVILLASNQLGRANDPAAPSSRRAFSVVNSPPGPPPAAPVVTNLTDPDSGETLVSGTSVASARIRIMNTNLGASITVDASAAGQFAGAIAAAGGDTLQLTAQKLSVSPQLSATTTVVVPVPPVVTNLLVSPATRLFTAGGQYDDFTVLAQLAGGGTSNVTTRASFSSSAPAVASANQSGRAVAQGNGVATLTATFKTNTATAMITVDIITVTNFLVYPTNVTLRFPTDTAQLSVTGQLSNGSAVPLGGVSFGSSDPQVATVNGAGTVAAVGDGIATIVAGFSNLPPRPVAVIVDNTLNPPPVVTILSPADGASVERGQLLAITVNALDPTGGAVRTEFRTTGQMVSSNGASYGPSASDTRAFPLTVPSNAPIGSAIQATAWATDVGAKTSAPVSITLNVADLTAPSVLILTPTNAQPFNDGFTVTVTVVSSDAVGVERVRYETSGALVLAGAQTNPLPLAATNVFSFIVPPGAPSPELYLTAFARDAAGNERTSTPVQVLLTGADITPPSTLATAVSSPVGATATVSYSVLSGLSDLKYVQLYFRRNGIGTFNLYTETAGTNVLGRFFPQSGTNGTVLFDSTQMGGDGAYELYSVGVDQIGNRELPPSNADQSAVFSAGTVWIHITASTNVAAGDASLDNANLRISNAVLTIEGTHAFRNVEVLGTGRLAHAEATLTNEPSFNVALWTLSVATNAAISVDGRGYLGGLRGGNGQAGNTTNNTDGSTPRSGGSHGGLGSAFDGLPNGLYGNLTQPTDLGSGGSGDGGGTPGGDGGGRIRLNAINIAADGALSANGQAGAGNASGSGSGGSIFVLTRSLSGRGLVCANGGADQAGGGGGRVAVQYTDMSTKDQGLIQALGGVGVYGTGGNGTVYLKAIGESDGTLVVDGQGVATPFSGLPIPIGVTFDNIILRNNARVVVDDPILVRNALEVQTGSILTHSVGQTNGLSIRCNSLLVDGTSAIDVIGKGYRGGLRDGNSAHRGETLFAQAGAAARAGGSHGGLGGVFDGLGGSLVYGSPYDPVHLGAGGSSDGGGTPGGNGGGRVTLVASNAVTIHGALRADGKASGGNAAGDGAGGSIRITTTTFQGSGTVSANGGGAESGGGGGRIAVDYTFIGAGSNDFHGLRKVTAAGGRGAYRAGSAGSVLFKQSSQIWGDLYVDATVTNATEALWSPLTPVGLGTVQALTTNTLQLDGGVPVLPGGLVGLVLKPNVNSPAEFVIVDNTTNVLTVAIPGATNLTTVAATGDLYAAVFRFDNVYLRRGAWLVTSDRLIANQALTLTENSVLTHFDAALNYDPALDVTADTITISADSAIDVTGRGYLGGLRGGNGPEGNTTNNANGSTARSGGSHGGLGGIIEGTPNPIYGDLKQPVLFGAGGSSDGGGTSGGDGGGRIRLLANMLLNDGVIAANGQGGANYSGSGAGGSILITASTVGGVGRVRANGGAAQTAGGGGRVAVYYASLAMAQTNFQAIAGDGSYCDGGHGTVFFKGESQGHGDLVMDGANAPSPDDSSPIPAGHLFDNITLRSMARVVMAAPLNVVDTLRVVSGSRLSHPRGLTNGIVINASNILVDATSSIDASAKGLRGGAFAGMGHVGETAPGQTGSVTRSGGSHGGLGGRVNGVEGPPGNIYDDVKWPVELGAGGSSDGGGTPGGSGGGRIQLHALDRVVIDGSVLANGQGGNNYSGSGAGGSVTISANTIAGSGDVHANGGAAQTGGGGGRVALYFASLSLPQDHLQAIGGDGGNTDGGHGTLFLKSAAQTLGDLVIDGANSPSPDDSALIPAGYAFDNITLRNQAKVLVNSTVSVPGAFGLFGGSRLSHSHGFTNGIAINASNITVDATSTIDVSRKGRWGGLQGGQGHVGETEPGQTGSTTRSGGSHGGLGGRVNGTEGPSGTTYGSLKQPAELGAGGSSDGGGTRGGNGGGRVSLQALGTLLVNGSIAADGEPGGNYSGSGAGGSVWIIAGAVHGTGQIRANGGVGETGGGGGRVALTYGALAFSQTNVQAVGGAGSNTKGGHGTVFFQSTSQTNGDLIVDGYGLAPAADTTPMPTNLVFDNVLLRRGAQVILTAPLVAMGTIQLSDHAVLTHPLSFEAGLHIEAGALLIGTNCVIDCTGRGRRGGLRDGNASHPGLTTNDVAGSTTRSAGSYGGLGGSFDGTANSTYGSVTNPILLGSGGSSDGGGTPGGNGGGRVTLLIAGLLQLDGAVRVDGLGGSGNAAGSGSGGSILVRAGTLQGIGSLEADGGGAQVGGGGGRIAVFVDNLVVSTNQVTAAGGIGSFVAGAAGTVYYGALLPAPILPPSLPIITALRMEVVRSPVSLQSSLGSAPVVIWTVARSDTGTPCVIEFSPTLSPWSGVYWGVHGQSVWTGALPAEAPGGFFRIRAP